MKISFHESDAFGEIAADGEYDLPVKSVLGHRFKLVDGKVVDRYNGVTDDEVKRLDEIEAQKQIKAEEQREVERQWARVRSERDRCLSDTDWVNQPDVPAKTKTPILAYRQKLRDITKQKDPFNIVWLAKPGG